MENKKNALNKCPLFSNIEEENLGAMLRCLGAVEKRFDKNTFIVSTGDAFSSIGVILSGNVHVIKEDFWGRRMILSQMGAGNLFLEAFSCAKAEKIPVSVLAVTASDILMLDFRKITSICSSACKHHAQLIRNMMAVLADQNVSLLQKIEHITRRTTREKLLSYLSAQAIIAKSSAFDIPFNRQELADFLAVDRSAMSSELCKMRDEGILLFERNHFKLQKSYDLEEHTAAK